MARKGKSRRGLPGAAFKSGPNKGMHKSEVCEGLFSGGKKKGKLKKGWKWQKGRGCPVRAKGKKRK